MWNCNIPPLVVVSICLSQRAKADPPLAQLLDRLDQVLQPAAQAIEAPHDERVARAKVVNARVELGAVLERARTDVLVDALAPGLLERIGLQRQVLLVDRYPRVADELVVVELRV